MVVSLSNVSPNHARHYYQSTRECSRTAWSGKLAQALGIAQSDVQTNAFVSLLQGQSPNGERLVNKTRVQQQQLNAKASGDSAPIERAGIDLTTSAPKSVSLQTLVFGDHQLEAAHRHANREMLRVLEERYAFTRITEGGKRFKVATGEVAIACFHHDTSRALDPQLHTHNVILNLQRHPKTGRWQSLDNTEIYKAKMLLGQIYRNELACAVQDLGYSIHITNRQHGLWELDGFTNKQLRAFSTRINQIEEAVGIGASSKAQAWANRMTRPEKVEYDRDDLEHHWQHQAQVTGLVGLQSQPVPIQSETTASLVMAQVIQWLAEWIGQLHAQVIERKELEQKLLQQPGRLPFSTLEQIIDSYLSQNPIPLIEPNPNVFQRVHGAFPQTDGTTGCGSAQQPLPSESHAQPSSQVISHKISQATTERAAFRESTATDRQFLSHIACPPEANAAWAHGTTRGKPGPTGHADRPLPELLCPDDERADYSIAADASESGDPPAGGQFDCRPQATPSEYGRISTDARGDSEATRLGQEFRALGELVAQVLERHERRTMVRTEDKTRPNDPCPDRPDNDSFWETSDSGASYLVNPLETDNLELERER